MLAYWNIYDRLRKSLAPAGSEAVTESLSDSLQSSAIFFAAAEAARYDAPDAVSPISFLRVVVAKLTASHFPLDSMRHFDVALGRDNKLFINFKSLGEEIEAIVVVPLLAKTKGYSGLDAAIFETGVFVSAFGKCLDSPIRSFFSAAEQDDLTSFATAFFDCVKELLATATAGLALTGRMLHNAVPWSIVRDDEQGRSTFDQLIHENVPTFKDHRATLAFRHLAKTAIATRFVMLSLDEFIDKGVPLPNHIDALKLIAMAKAEQVIEPARSLLLETIAYSCNRTARKSEELREKVKHWMNGANLACEATKVSRIPRQSKYVAENLAQASIAINDIVGRKFADAIFSDAYAIGHLWGVMHIRADKLNFKPVDGATATRFTINNDVYEFWKSIPPYSQDQFFVQRFMSETLKVTTDNLAVNLMSGFLFAEQFLRDVNAKAREVPNMENIHFITAYEQYPDSVSLFHDRWLLFREPFLWAFMIAYTAFNQHDSGITALMNCGYHEHTPKVAKNVDSLLRFATCDPSKRLPLNLDFAMPNLSSFLRALSKYCPDDAGEKEQLLALTYSFEKHPF